MHKITTEQFLAHCGELNPDKDVDIYIDIPFCHSKCAYCSLSPVIVSQSSEIVQRYMEFLQYMLQGLEKLSLPRVRTLYLGGGTPNFLSPHQLGSIVSESTLWNTAKFRVMECHPAYLSDEYLNLVADTKITKISLGVQSLIPQVLSNNRRVGVSSERLTEILGFLSANAIHSSVDLIMYIDSGDYTTPCPEEQGRFLHDLRDMAALSPDSMDLYAEHANCYQFDSDGSRLLAFHEVIAKFCQESDYAIPIYDCKQPLLQESSGRRNTNQKIIQRQLLSENGEEMFPYDSSPPDGNAGKTNIIALGGLRGHNSAYGTINGVPYFSRMDIDGSHCIYMEDTNDKYKEH